jgi:hypothetical protein
MSKSSNQSCGFDAQTGKPPPPWIWGSAKKPTADFETKPGDTVATSFETKLEKIIATDFEAKVEKTVAAGFEAKPLETVVIGFQAKPAKTIAAGFEAKPLETVDLGFKAQPRNLRSTSPRARCRPHTAPPDLSITRPPSAWPVRPSPVLCTRYPTPTTILIAARHAAPATFTPRDKQTRFSKWNKGKRKTKRNCPGFEFKPRQVNDLSQSNQETDHLVSQSPPWWIHWQQKHKVWSLKFESKTPSSTARRPKKLRNAQEGHLEEGKPQKPANNMKTGKAKQNDKKELRKAQNTREAQNQHKSSPWN